MPNQHKPQNLTPTTNTSHRINILLHTTVPPNPPADLQCSICHKYQDEDFEIAMRKPLNEECPHTFHSTCLDTWVNGTIDGTTGYKSKKCPECYVEICTDTPRQAQVEIVKMDGNGGGRRRHGTHSTCVIMP